MTLCEQKLSDLVHSVDDMETTRDLLPASQVLAQAAALFDQLNPDRGLLSDADRLALVAAAVRFSASAQALAATLAGEADAVEAAEHESGVPLASWLAANERLTRGEAHRLIRHGENLTRFTHLAEATMSGEVLFDQANAIGGVLAKLPTDFNSKQVAEAETLMIGYAGEFDSAGLARLTRRLVELLDPTGADEREAKRLERELKAARAGRHLTFKPDGYGSVLIRGSLPTLDAEPLIKLIDAYAQQERRAALDRQDGHGQDADAPIDPEEIRLELNDQPVSRAATDRVALDRLDPLAETITAAMRRADALCVLVAAHQLGSTAPSVGGDRPRVVVTLDYDKLRHECIDASLLESHTPVTAGELRQLACDCEVLPVVLNGASEGLDVGRAQRLVTPAIRTALVLRDRGCTFPGCNAPASACHAHHLIPWWNGGKTALENLALVCPHHHNLIEPTRDGPPGRRWELRIGADGVPEVLPPDYYDPTRTPRRHQRFRYHDSG